MHIMGKVKEEINAYLKKNKFCVLCTCSGSTPRATPVRYWYDGRSVIVFSEKYTAKFKLLRKNRSVSLALYSARPPVRGLQLWGTAEVITHTDPRHDRYLPAMIKNNPKLQAAKKILHLILITPRKALMLDQSRAGYRYLLWETGRSGREKEQEIKNLRGASRLT